jgi:hypothetical protein
MDSRNVTQVFSWGSGGNVARSRECEPDALLLLSAMAERRGAIAGVVSSRGRIQREGFMQIVTHTAKPGREADIPGPRRE